MLSMITAFLLAAANGEPAALPSLLSALAESDATAAKVREDVTMSTLNEELASNGDVKRRLEKVMRLTHGPGTGVPKPTLLRATEDGEDVTAREREKLAKEVDDEKDETKKRRNDSLSSLNPFSAENQPKYRFTLMPPTPGAQPRIHFRPVEPGEKLFEGDAWVDPETRTLVTVTAVPSKLPFYVRRAVFKVDFEPGRAPQRLSHFRVEGEGGFLFFKKRFRVKARFSDYAPPPTLPGTP